jgi:hypothetical protein
MIPLKVTGAGNNDAQNCYRVTFDEALSSAPKYEAWDNSEVWPAVDAAGTTVLKEIFTGTAGNSNLAMLSLVATTSASPGEDWKPAAATGGTDNPNRMKGDTSYVTDPTTPDAAEAILFNMCLEVPHDATVPSTSSMNALLQIVYTYTGDAPTPVWAANEGTEGEPSWTTLTPGTHGIKFCNDDAVAGTPATHKLTLPAASTVDDGAQVVST